MHPAEIEIMQYLLNKIKGIHLIKMLFPKLKLIKINQDVISQTKTKTIKTQGFILPLVLLLRRLNFDCNAFSS